MTDSTLALDIPVLLPGVADERDRCVELLREGLARRKGVGRVHVAAHEGSAKLCVHFDPNLISLSELRRSAEQAGAQVTGRYRHETLHVTDMDCADCALSIEHILRRREGVLSVSVNYAAERLWVEYDAEAIDLRRIAEQVRGLGYAVEEQARRVGGVLGWVRGHEELVLSLLSGFFLMLGFAGETLLRLPPSGSVVLYALAYVSGGWDATRHGIKAALNRSFSIDFLMVVAAGGAAILGEWAEGALLLFLFSLGHALEHAAMDRARHAIEALGKITPRVARVERGGRELEIPVEELLRGDRVVVRPGDRIPIDGRVAEGRSAVDQSPITGESVPVEKAPGDDVFAGSLNGEAVLEIEVTRLAGDTTLARVVRMVEEAQAQKSPTQQFTDRFQRVFVPAVLVGVVAMIVVPPLLGWLDWSTAFLRSMTVLVAGSPCALAIATPAAVLSGIAQAARRGVLVKGGVHLENLGALRAVAFDKTGTITRGEPAVTDLAPAEGVSDVELLRTAAAVESRSAHPLAKAVVRRAEAAGLGDLPQVEALESASGRGLRATVAGRRVRIGNRKLFADEGQALPAEIVRQAEALEASGKTTMIVEEEGRFLGVLGLADEPREAARATLERLRALGVEALVMLSGDNERVAAAISREVGLTEYRAPLLPEEKVREVRDLTARFGSVAMVGDGVNDAPALAASTVGIAMGAGGADVALETADVALMADDLSKLPFVVGLGRQSRRIIRQNLIVSLGVIAFLVLAAVFGLSGIGGAIIFHEGSTLAVVGNALRLLAYE